MRTIAVLSGFVVFATCASVRNDCVYPEKIGNEPDYYWRNYFGIIPKDAVPGGYDETGNVSFIGQLPSEKHAGIYSGNLYAGQKEAVAIIGEKVIEGTYVKILCSNPVNKFEWMQTTSDDSHLLTDYHWVIGGAQGKVVTYVGRANFEGQVQVGCVFNSQQVSKGLWLYSKSGDAHNFKSFELLVLAR